VKALPAKAGATKSPDVVVVGSVALDLLHTPFASTEAPVLGGSALHFANAASLFAKVGVVGVVGEDYPMKDLEFLTRRNVDLSGVGVLPGKSFLWEGRYGDNFLSRETIRTELGVFESFEPLLPKAYLNPKILFLAAIHPALQYSVLKQVNRPKLVAIDTFKLWIDVARKEFMKVLKQSDLFFVNDDEVRWLTGEHNLFKGAAALRKMGPKWVVVKKGEHGSFVVGERDTYLSNTFPVLDVVDPTGAGDAFAGGMLGYLAGERQITAGAIRRAMAWASVIGSFYVEGFGPAGLRDKKRADVDRRYRQFVRMSTIP
jgi:sugar/nucleoside kinase (ribokinase family)